jgi:hypothetical protein
MQERDDLLPSDCAIRKIHVTLGRGTKHILDGLGRAMDQDAIRRTIGLRTDGSAGNFLYRLAFVAAASVVLLATASAETFKSSFLTFSLPTGWHCDLEGSEYVCEPTHPRGHKVSMIIILAAKYAGDKDTVADYEAYLRGNRSVTGGSSLVDGPRINNDIGKVAWLEATHFESELKGFYTTYVATVQDGIAVFVTFSASKDAFPTFREMIRPCIQSLAIKSRSKKPNSKGKKR